MSNDRFKFRAWDENRKFYPIPTDFLIDYDGNLWEQCTPIDNSDNHLIIEQCTGLRDKNGKLIFEGDVVNMYIPYEDNYYKCVVQYVIDEGTAQWLAVYLEGKRHHMSLGIAYDITTEYLDGSYCTVIGTIHDEQFREVTKMVEKGE